MSELLHHLPNTNPEDFNLIFEQLPPEFYVSLVLLNFGNPDLTIRDYGKVLRTNLGRRRIPHSIYGLCNDLELTKAEVKIQGNSYPKVEREDNWALMIFLANAQRSRFLQSRRLLGEREIDNLNGGTSLIVSPQFNHYQADRLINWFNNLKQPQSRKPVNIPPGCVWVETNSEELN